MAEGNGIDLGSIYGLLVDIGKTVSRLAGTADQQATRLAALERGLAANTTELAELRQTVGAYHGSVVAAGVMHA